MARDMVVGQFYPADSLLHRLDPRVKLMGTVVFLISVFRIRSIPGFLAVTAFLAAMIALSKVPVGLMLKNLRGIMAILIITFLFSAFLTPGTVLWKLGFLKITHEGLRTGGYMLIRLSYMVVGASILTLTTTPKQLTDGIEKGLGFLSKLKIPVHEFAMMMAIALKFIPVLMNELGRIMDAQRSRGADFDSGGIIHRAKALIPIIVPLFVAAIRRANQLEMAMDARCYNGGEGRTKLHPLAYAQRDYIAYIVLILYLALVMLLWVKAHGV